MSSLREKKEYMAMRVSGFLGWLHRLVMFITFPIRKFWMIVTVLLLILMILIAIPMFYGIPLRDVWDWYMIKMPNHEFVEAKDKTLFGAKEQVDKLRRTFNEIVPTQKSKAETKGKKEKTKTKLVAWHVAEFKKAKYKPLPAMPIIEKNENVKNADAESVGYEENEKIVSEPIAVEEISAPANEDASDNIIVLEQEYETEATPVTEETEQVSMQEQSSVNEEQTTEENITEPTVASETEKTAEPVYDYAENIKNYYTEIRNADLSYLPEPIIYEGNVKVIGPNSIFVQGKFLFLYGIYSDPQRYDTDAAINLLQNITRDRNVYCVAVARSIRTRAQAALCFVDGIFINKELVEHNLAQNKALK